MAFGLQNSTFQLQKWHFAYKVLLLEYKNCISNYKVASRATIQYSYPLYLKISKNNRVNTIFFIQILNVYIVIWP